MTVMGAVDRDAPAGREHGPDTDVVDNLERADRALVHQPPHPRVGLKGAGHTRDPEVGRVEAEVGPLRTAEGERVTRGDVEAFLAEAYRETGLTLCHITQGISRLSPHVAQYPVTP